MDEVELLENYVNNGCQRSFEALYNKFSALIDSFSWNNGVFDQDLRQELCLTLEKTLKSFDKSKKTKIITILKYKLQGTQSNYRRKLLGKKHTNTWFPMLDECDKASFTYDPALICEIIHLTPLQIGAIMATNHKPSGTRRLKKISAELRHQ